MASNTFQQGNQAAMWLHRLYITIEALQCTFHINLSETIMEQITASYIAIKIVLQPHPVILHAYSILGSVKNTISRTVNQIPSPIKSSKLATVYSYVY